MSLRTRLALLAGFAIVALAVASFVAWRLARATETFALRQADSSVQAAARDLAGELHGNPEGYLVIDQALPDPPDQRREKGPRANETRGRHVPPHVERLFAAYPDPLARLTAITLHRYRDVAGGFYRPGDGELTGYAFPGESSNGNVPADVVDVIRAVASETVTSGAPTSRTVQIGADRVILVTYPAQEGSIATAWAMQRLAHRSGVADWPGVSALIALALSIIAVTGLALLTVRDLRLGVTGIETGLDGLKGDLSQQLSAPDTTELARIAAAINELAASLRANIDRRAELERELRQSERLSALGRVVAGVAHEVRNPLAAIKLKVQLANRSAYPPEKLAETFRVITSEIERLDSLVRRLLELGGQRTLERRAVDLVALIRGRVSFFSDISTQSGVLIKHTTLAESIMVHGDPDRLGQVVDNIVQNALDAMPRGGQLLIACTSLAAPNGSPIALVSFDDSGQGISEADQKHIFEPFHTNRATGTGLGLAIARAIVEEHGGRLSFVSRAGQGASFVIELPSINQKPAQPEEQ